MRDSEKRHPIQVVARRTGMTADRLRAWEKRYSVVEPARSDGGRRLYSDEDIELLRLLHKAILGGRRISRVAGMDVEALSELVREDEEAEAERPTVGAGADASGDPGPYLEACLAAIEGFESQELEAVLRRAVVNLSASTLVERLAAPLMREVGERWVDGRLTPAHEHLATQIVGRVIGDVVETAEPQKEAPRIVIGTVSGHLHEFGALFAAATAATQGWRVIYLGPDLPARDLAGVATDTRALAVAVSLVYPHGSTAIGEELRELRLGLPGDVALLVGGPASLSYRGVLRGIGAHVIEDIAALRRVLARLA